VSPTIAILGTLDTKGVEHAFVASCIRKAGFNVLMIDVGTGSDPQIPADVSRFEVASSAGIDLQPILDQRDRGQAVATMVKAAPCILEQLRRNGKIDGVISLGGGGGTAIASAAMRGLPIGFPKMIVSTLASGNIAHYIGTSDIVMMSSIVDIQGLNRISKTILSRAAGAIVGMARVKLPPDEGKPIIVASMFGNTTACVNSATPILEAAGYEVLVFAATGTGGRTMEALIDSGMVAGVLDITTTELADELVGGVLSAGPDRLYAASRARVPAIVVPGCLDMVNFGEPSTVPPGFEGRTFYFHNPQVTLMRTNVSECKQLGENLARAVNSYLAPCCVLIPKRAISVISAPGGPFHDPQADTALFDAIAHSLNPDVELEIHDCEINDLQFGRRCAQRLIELIAAQRSAN